MRRRKWREGKVRPIPGSSPHDRLVSWVISSSLKESLRRSLPRHCFPHLQTILGAQYAFLRHVGIYLVRCGFKIKTQNQTLGWGRAASRWSAPSPGSRTCREDHAPPHRPQMSSDRLFLDRVARQHCPSPLHRHAQTTTPPRTTRQKPDISTLQGIGHFYFALTGKSYQQAPHPQPCDNSGFHAHPGYQRNTAHPAASLPFPAGRSHCRDGAGAHRRYQERHAERAFFRGRFETRLVITIL